MFVDNFSSLEGGFTEVFDHSDIPIFQNKVYPSQKEALSAKCGTISLIQSNISGFVFNRIFDPALMNYDENYQNDQSNSPYFLTHLETVLKLLTSFGVENKKVIEIGCGKGVFLELMLNAGIDCWGFDPTYEGSNPRVIKDYFSSTYKNIHADLIIMRHTLEHIPNPFSFLHMIGAANNYRGKIFIEVPTFDWILKKEAFWDIFYEHCNYFTQKSLQMMFLESISGELFGGQYIYLYADFDKLKTTISSKRATNSPLNFSKKMCYYREFLENHPSLAIWGAGGKGATFLNILDPKQNKIKYVIDINPVKQGKFIARTGHAIYSPEILKKRSVQHILVMNENYLEEVQQIVRNNTIQFSAL